MNRPDMTLDVYRGRKTTMQQQQLKYDFLLHFCLVEFQGICFLRHAKLLDGRKEQT